MQEEREGQVRAVEITHDGVTYQASYFVENNIIHAQIAGHSVVTPIGNVAAADTVKALLAEHVVSNGDRH